MTVALNRIFIALPASDTRIITSLEPVYGILQKFNNAVKIVPAENLHITVRFFGEVTDAVCEDISSGFRRINGLKKIGYEMRGIGSFPSSGKPSVIWAGMKCSDEIDSLVKGVEILAADSGFRHERRKFIPHLTLARIKSHQNFPSALKKSLDTLADIPFESSAFNELVLYRSYLKKGGAEYERLACVLLE